MTIDEWNRTMGEEIQDNKITSADQLHDELCEQFEVNYPILNTFSYLPNFPDVDIAKAVMGATNDMLLDQYLDEYDEFKGMAGTEFREPDRAAEEINRMGNEKDIVGIYLENGAEQKPLGDPYYDPIYKAAEDNDLPVAYHSSAGSIFMQGYPVQHRGFRKFLEEHVVAHPFAMMQTMTSLVVQGVPEKFPDLDFVILEVGIEFLPSVMFRLNKEYSIRRVEASLSEKSPEKYIRDSFYVGTQPIGEPNDPEDMRRLIKVAGPEMILFATDWPHWDFDDPEAVDKFLRTKFELEERNAMLSGNASGIYDLGGKMSEHVVGSMDELDANERILAECEGREIAVFNIDGEYHAVLNWSAHQGGPCGEGKVTGTIVDATYDREDMEVSLEWGKDEEILNCPWHAWEYEISTGECLSRQGVQLPTYPVRCENGDAIVSL